MKKKILMLGNGYPSIFAHRREIVEALRSEGHEEKPDAVLAYTGWQ